jgi:hypothetical protein
MQRFHIVMTFGYKGKPESSLASLSRVDDAVEFLNANNDDVTFYTEIEALTGMDAAVKTLTRAKRVEERLLVSLLELEMQHCPDAVDDDVAIN